MIAKLKALRSIFNLIIALPFFCLGSIFFIFYKNKISQLKNPFFLKASFVFFLGFLFFNNYHDVILLGVILLFVLLFCLMVYYPKSISFLNNKFLNAIGVSSYFLYLIHENLGVFLIYKNLLVLERFYFLQPICLILLLIALSVVFTTYLESYVIQFLKNALKKRQ